MVCALLAGVYTNAALSAQSLSCDGIPIEVTAPTDALAQRACDTARRSQALFASCNVPPISHPVHVDITTKIESDCYATFHCGEDRIEILPPRSMAQLRTSDDLFGFLSDERYFDSVLTHELAHAVFDRVACSYGTCRATTEYLAYTMQILSLTPAQREIFEQRAGFDPDRPTDNATVNVMILAMAPDVFASRVWAHVNARGDICGAIGRVTSGELIFDGDWP